jgi:hypothetical protein
MRAPHSTEGPAGRRLAELRVWLRAGRAALAAAALAAAALLAAVAQAQVEDTTWRDLEGRIQYGYYTEDAAALRAVATTLGESEAHDKLHGYYAALLEWRLALLAARPGAPAYGPSAAQLTQRCVSDLDGALALDADFADALALRSACLATALTGGGAHVPFAAHRVRKDFERALQLAPGNPRVLLLDALADDELADAKDPERERLLPNVRRTVVAFEAERRGPEQLPGWGAAEAWLLLARELLEHGDPLGARDALEHALLIAPQFAAARRLMAQITAG